MEQILHTVIFGCFAVLLIGFSIAVVTTRSVFRGALALAAALSIVAGLFALLGADFVAAGQLLIYVGGIMIIMLFVVMFSQQPRDKIDRQTNEQWFWGLLIALAIASHLAIQFYAWASKLPAEVVPTATTASVGRLLLGEMVVPFEAVSLVLLAALVGAVYFGLPREEK